MGHEQFTWVSLIPGLSKLPPHVSNAIIVSLVLVVIVVIGYIQLRRTANEVIPDERLTFRNFLEIIVEAVLGLVEGNMGPHGKKFVLIIGTLGLFILFNNLSGLVPGFLPATDNVNTTFACSLTVFFLTHYYGVREHGIGYLKQFMGPIWWLAPIMIPIEIIGNLSRPLSLGLRLFGNIMGDHLVTSIFFMLIPLFVPLIGMILGTFVAFVQSFVFVLLSMAYFSGAVSHEEH
jgi:F-type H+-transporting ATPase subunit a